MTGIEWLKRVLAACGMAVCPACQLVTRASAEIDGDTHPDALDVRVCGSCGHVGIYDNAVGSVRSLSAGEEWIRHQPSVKRIVAAVAESYAPEEAVRLLKPDL